MKTRARKVLLWGLAVLAVLAMAFAYAASGVPIPERSEFGPPLSELRALATSAPGPLPTQLRSLRIGTIDFKRFVVVAGGGFSRHLMTFYTYQLVYPDKTIMVDAVNDAATQQSAFPGATFFPESYARMQQALRRASAIVITHEHYDHSAGIARSPDFNEIAPRVQMTAEQLSSPALEGSGFTPEQLRALKPLRYERLHLLAPGVVLVKAPGHTPGSQLVYVRLADGQELLLIGDVAWNMENVRLPRMHPRMVNWAVHEDGRAMAHQLRYLHDLTVSAPEVHVVSAHDGTQMEELVRQGLVQDGLL